LSATLWSHARFTKSKSPTGVLSLFRSRRRFEIRFHRGVLAPA
jgi:hypothetical protein